MIVMKTRSTSLFNTRTLIMLGLFSAIAFVVMAVGRIPVVSFLKYEPKDVVITIAGFLYGPLSAVLVSVVVSLIEMVTVSTTGPIGFVMNVLATLAFACPAAFLYKRRKSFPSAVTGLVVGVLMMTGVMLLWNYLITPLYLHTPRAEVAAMLLPVFLPFNLLKGSINAALVVLLYKPLVNALRRMGLTPRPAKPQAAPQKHKISAGAALVALVVLATCILIILVMQGVI